MAQYEHGKLKERHQGRVSRASSVVGVPRAASGVAAATAATAVQDVLEFKCVRHEKGGIPNILCLPQSSADLRHLCRTQKHKASEPVPMTTLEL